MAIAAGTTAYSARIIKDVVDEIFIARNLNLLVPLSMTIIGLSLAKVSPATREVVMSRIGNRIAENQRRVTSSAEIRRRPSPLNPRAA
jgi:ATP-binding cassette subfamily B protein